MIRAVKTLQRGKNARMLRIVGGTWRGRRFRFPDSAEIRPTPDRVRETLFNWLAAQVGGARCLDLFAGSGALGLEALSRGASSALFVEQDAAAAREIQTRLAEWGATGATVARTDAMQFLNAPPDGKLFELVFLDPPFDSSLLFEAAQRLESGGWLTPDALIYVESRAADALVALPETWHALKSKRAGEVGYHLFERRGPGGAVT